MIYALLIFIAILLFYVVGTYNSFATLRGRIKASIQEIGNQLKRQSDFIPNLNTIANKVLAQERGIFDKLTDARKSVIAATESGGAQEMVDASNRFFKAMEPVKVILESNPQLQSQAAMMDFMNEWRDTSDKVSYARRTLIDLSADYNIKLATIPSGWIGQLFGFQPEKGLKTPEEGEHLEVSAEETKTPTVV